MIAKQIQGCFVAIAVWSMIAPPGHAEPITFVSTQLQPIVAAQNMRDVVLGNFIGEVTFRPETVASLMDQLTKETAGGTVAIDLIGALPRQLAPLAAADALDTLDTLIAGIANPAPIPALAREGKLDTDHQLFVPWMRATYLMAANKKALAHLPEGAALDSLTYAQLGQWAANLQAATGEAKLGFATGQGGTIDRFVEGYLYPSYTGGMVRSFKSAAATAMWANVQKLWQHTAAASTGYDAMQAPLLSEDVWIAFDHIAGLRDAFLQEPDQFVAFPAPVGPRGRGFMPVLVGLAIAKGAPEHAAAVRLIDYLMRPETQITTVQELGFYPTLEMPLPENIQPGIRAIGKAMRTQASATNALATSLPSGLGVKSAAFDQIYRDTFAQIVLDGDRIADVLTRQATKLAALMTATGARCAPPDAASDGPCPVE